MDRATKRLRVVVEFSPNEAQAFLAVCQLHFRLPDDELRYLADREARQHGVATDTQGDFNQGALLPAELATIS